MHPNCFSHLPLRASVELRPIISLILLLYTVCSSGVWMLKAFAYAWHVVPERYLCVLSVPVKNNLSKVNRWTPLAASLPSVEPGRRLAVYNFTLTGLLRGGGGVSKILALATFFNAAWAPAVWCKSAYYAFRERESSGRRRNEGKSWQNKRSDS